MTRYIAEVGPCNNSIEYAHEAVEAAADAGAWGFKVQMYQADTLTTRDAPRYDNLAGDEENQYQQFQNALPYDAWDEVAAHCDELDLVFLASVFDEEAIEWCEEWGVSIYKVASGDITNLPLMDSLAQTGKPILFSTGASYVPEILRAADWLQGYGIPMACTSSYPCEPQHAQTARVTTLLEHFDVVGYSDHTSGLTAPASAEQLGAEYVEVHFTIRPGTGGDHDFAKTSADLARLVGEVILSEEFAGLVQGDGVLAPQTCEQAARWGARRSIYAKGDMAKGHNVTFDDLAFLRPAVGLEPWQWAECLGKLNEGMTTGQAF